MTFEISPGLPGGFRRALEQMLAATADTLAVSKVLQDGYIQLNFQTPELPPTHGTARAPVSGAFVWCDGRFYVVQGRMHTDASLDKWEQSTGRKIAPEIREQYKQKGGALQLEGRCTVLGTLVNGRETLDRIAALPNDASGRPLRAVPVRMEGRK